MGETTPVTMGITLHIPKTWSLRDLLKTTEHSGRPRNKPAGTWILDDLVEGRLTVLLCTSCRSGFDYKRYKYYPFSDKQDMYAGGRCENCRISSDQLYMYMPEENVGKTIVTREEERHAARHATHIGG